MEKNVASFYHYGSVVTTCPGQAETLGISDLLIEDEEWSELLNHWNAHFEAEEGNRLLNEVLREIVYEI